MYWSWSLWEAAKNFVTFLYQRKHQNRQLQCLLFYCSIALTLRTKLGEGKLSTFITAFNPLQCQFKSDSDVKKSFKVWRKLWSSKVEHNNMRATLETANHDVGSNWPSRLGGIWRHSDYQCITFNENNLLFLFHQTFNNVIVLM